MGAPRVDILHSDHYARVVSLEYGKEISNIPRRFGEEGVWGREIQEFINLHNPAPPPLVVGCCETRGNSDENLRIWTKMLQNKGNSDKGGGEF